MAFGRSTITKEELVAAGLDPDKIKEYQEKGVTKDDLTAMSTALETKLTTTVTDLIKNSFLELEGKFNKIPNKDNNNDNNNNNNNNEEKPDEQTEFLTDPVRFINQKSGAVYGAAAIEFKKMSRDMAWKDGLTSLKGLRNATLKAEIEEEWKKYTPQKMAQNNTDPALCLQQIHDMILGKHHDEIMQDSNKKDGKFNLVHSGTGSGSGNRGAVDTTNNSNKNELSEADKAMAKKFGMTEEEWIKQGEDMEKEEVDRKAGVLTGSSK